VPGLESILPAAAIYQRNSAWAQPPHPEHGYLTPLDPMQELAFRGWVEKNKIPFDPSPTADYDMRGFYKALQAGEPIATSAVNPNDKQLHFTDFFKTPFHPSFSRESRWATENAPTWNDKDQLVDKSGKVIFDERAK
jgi:hypothetical protein